MSTTAPLFSIIMPVYNVEKYLKTAIESVREQLFKDWELLLVNDASTDSSLNICENYAQTDSRILVINKKHNEGLSEARNTGLKSATGDWILFIDSDDQIESFALEHLARRINQNLDIIVFGLTQEYEDANGKVIHKDCLLPSKSGSKDCDIGTLVVHLDYERIFPYAWNKLYNHKFLITNNLWFERTKMIEDFLFNISAFKCNPTIECIPESYYKYRKPAHTTLASCYLENFHLLCLRRLNEELDMLFYYGSANSSNKNMVYMIHIKHIFSSLIRVVTNHKMSFKEHYMKIKEILSNSEVHNSLNVPFVSNFLYKILSSIMYHKRYIICYLATRLYIIIKE